MSVDAGATGGGAAVAMAIANAIKASGVLVRVEPREFERILERRGDPLVVHTYGGFFAKRHQYLTSYKGLAFHAKSDTPLVLPPATEVVEAKSISIPE